MTTPDFSFENKLHKKGFKLIAGMDEVGRGSFAGPVVAAAVAFNKQISNLAFRRLNVSKYANITLRDKQIAEGIKINDSKQLTAKQRELADVWIRKNAIAFGIGQASVTQINKFGIKKATEIAFRKAITSCGVKIDFLLMDAFYVPYLRGLRHKNQLAIIKGDTKSISIAAASIIAKVYRDRLMTKLSKQPKYKKYKWDENKGYGTKSHQDAIQKYGVTSMHRKQFVKNCVSSQVQ